jgi:CO/xanthine dehydrogenase Mo-binding subunit
MKFYMRTAVTKEGKLLSLHMRPISNNGAYASHGHTIVMSAGGKFRLLYDFNSMKYEPKTVYTNLPVAGAMRGYGCPQIFYALESHIEDIAREMNMDPIEFRKQNLISVGKVDPNSGIVVRSFGLPECIEKPLGDKRRIGIIDQRIPDHHTGHLPGKQGKRLLCRSWGACAVIPCLMIPPKSAILYLCSVCHRTSV